MRGFGFLFGCITLLISCIISTLLSRSQCSHKDSRTLTYIEGFFDAVHGDIDYVIHEWKRRRQDSFHLVTKHDSYVRFFLFGKIIQSKRLRYDLCSNDGAIMFFGFGNSVGSGSKLPDTDGFLCS